jgi:hypothetical protein
MCTTSGKGRSAITTTPDRNSAKGARADRNSAGGTIATRDPPHRRWHLGTSSPAPYRPVWAAPPRPARRPARHATPSRAPPPRHSCPRAAPPPPPILARAPHRPAPRHPRPPSWPGRRTVPRRAPPRQPCPARRATHPTPRKAPPRPARRATHPTPRMAPPRPARPALRAPPWQLSPARNTAPANPASSSFSATPPLSRIWSMGRRPHSFPVDGPSTRVRAAAHRTTRRHPRPPARRARAVPGSAGRWRSFLCLTWLAR